MTRNRGAPDGPSVEEAIIEGLKKYLVMVYRHALEENPEAIEESRKISQYLIEVVAEHKTRDAIALYIAVVEVAIVSMEAMVESARVEMRLRDMMKLRDERGDN